MAGQNLLPQSALPVGQTPLATIQTPNVPVSVPNPIDISNFFRMQQTLSNNAGILQNAEQIAMQRQQMDLENYEAAIRGMDAVMGMANNAFSDFYQGKKSQRSTKGGISPMYGGLDPTRSRHQEAMQRNNGKIDAAEEQIDQLGRNLFATGASDPAARMEATRNIENVIRQTRRDLEQDGEFFELSRMHQAYNQWLDQLKVAESKGANINVAAVDAMEAKYNQWTNDGTGNVGLGDFRISDYVYDGPGVLKRIAADAKQFGTGTVEFEEVPTSGGGVLEGKRFTRRSLNDISQAMSDKYMSDKDAISLYNNTVKGRKNQDGSDYTFNQWMRDLSAPYAPIAGKESVIANTESFLVKPGDKASNPASGRSKGTGFDNGSMLNVLGRAPKDASDRSIVTLGNAIQQKGYNVSDPNTALSPYDWGKMAKLDQKGKLDIVEVDENGNKVAQGKGVAIHMYDKGEVEDDGTVVQPRRFLAEFPKAGKTQEGVGAEPPPQPEVFQHNIRTKILPARRGADRGSRNNNPGNIRATDAQLQAGVKVDDKGFVIFENLKEGVDANFKDVNLKIDGRSQQFQNNPHLIDKYGKDQLAPGKYLEVATVEDLLHVRTPRSDYGGDNSPEEFEGFLKHLEKRGFPRDMKLKDLQDKFNFNASIFEIESPDAYRRAFGKGGVMPTAHSDEITVEAPSDAQKKQTKEGFVPTRTATLTGEGLSRNTFDRLITGDDAVSEDEIRQLFANPPKGLEETVKVAQDTWEDRAKKEDEWETLVAKRDALETLGKTLPDDEQQRLDELEGQIEDLEDASSINGLSRSFRVAVANNMEQELVSRSINKLLDADDGLSPGQSRTFRMSGDDREGMVVMRSSASRDRYAVVPFTEDSDGNRDVGDVQLMDRERAMRYVTEQADRFNDETVADLVDINEADEGIVQQAQQSINARSEMLKQRQAELDAEAKAANDIETRRRAAIQKKKDDAAKNKLEESTKKKITTTRKQSTPKKTTPKPKPKKSQKDYEDEYFG